ncbi:MAG: gliding motility-associated C-terminal domain-containing protein [Chitinophagales bacterium]
MFNKIFLLCVFLLSILSIKTISAQSPTPFQCPVMLSIVNEGPNQPEHPSFISVINAATGALGTQIAVKDASGTAFKTLNGIAINSQDGLAYAQYQRIPTQAEVILALLTNGNYTSTSTLVQIGANGIGVNLGTLNPPVNAGFNTHSLLGLLGTADNSGVYYAAAAEAQVNLADTSVSDFKLYIGKINVPGFAVVWTEIQLATSCTAFRQAFIDAVTSGRDAGAEDMVWDPNSGKILFYAGADKVLGVVDMTSNTGVCYTDANGVVATTNLGGLAIDSIGQMIALESSNGKVWRIDTRGCVDGNPATPCINSLTQINSFTVNGNSVVRGDAASCVLPCVPPTIQKSDIVTCINKNTTIDISVSGATNPYTYIWGKTGIGTLSNTTNQDASFVSAVTGTAKLYVTVSDRKGCQNTDSLNVTVNSSKDTTRQTATICGGDVIQFGSQTISAAGIYYNTVNGTDACDSVIELTVTLNCAPTPFACPAMLSVVNEGPNLPEHPSYIAVVNPATGALGTQIPVKDVTTGNQYLSLNGLALNSQDGLGYVQYQKTPTANEVRDTIAATGQYLSSSTLYQVGSNGRALALGTINPPVNAGFNTHAVVSLLATANNSGTYFVTAAEAQITLPNTIVSSKFYLGRITLPGTAVTWSEIAFDASCTAFQQAFIDAITNGNDAGAQDMVWDASTNKIWFYAGSDRVLSVVDVTTNAGTCYGDNNGVTATTNLGGLALDSIGQMIGLESTTGKVWRIDTRGCTDGNPATPCMTSVAQINSYTVNGNSNTRVDAASCALPCVPPTIQKSDIATCVNKNTTIDISVSGATNPYTYIWGNYPGQGTLTNTTNQDASYVNATAGTYKVYVTVSDKKGCQQTDSLNIIVSNTKDTTKATAGLCGGQTIQFGNQTISAPGIYYNILPGTDACDSVIQLTVSATCAPTQFICPATLAIVNEGPNEPEHPSFIATINPTTGALDTQIAVVDSLGTPFKSLNGIALNSADGFAYAQYQKVPTRQQAIDSILATGNFISRSQLIKIGSNGQALNLGTLSPPISAGLNTHVMIGLLGTADNSGNYYVTAAEGNASFLPDTITNFKLYIGKITLPSLTPVYSEIVLDNSCNAFRQAFIDAIRSGTDAGAQDMVWDPTTNKILLYSGSDKVLGVVDLAANTGTCYADANGAVATTNLGGLAMDSIGQFIALESNAGKVWRIDTRGCIDGNPGTPCINDATEINAYTVNGNSQTRTDAASCIEPCTKPTITKRNFITCVNTPIQLNVTTNATNYTWGIYSGNGTLINTSTATPIYVNAVAGNYKVYVTVENATGCQNTDSLFVTVVNKPDTTKLTARLCTNKDDSVIFNGQIIKDAGSYLAVLVSFANCDSIVRLDVTESFCNTNPPVAVEDDTIVFNDPIVINVLNNDFDPDGDSIYICGGTNGNGIIIPPVNGTVQINSDSISYTYTPGISHGIDSFQYQICSIDGDSTAWVIIEIDDCKIPNTFSPNGDSKNDFFDVPCIEGVASLSVFNRWGAPVYQNDKYDNINDVFNGKYKGSDLPDGTYYYILKYTNLLGTVINRTGFVVLHR